VASGRRPHVGLADDFQQRRPGPIQVDAAVASAGDLVVHAVFAGVLLQVNADDPDVLRARPAPSIADAATGLRELNGRSYWLIWVSLGQVGIVVVFAVPLGERGNLAIQREGRLQGQLKRRRFITGSTPGMPMQTGQVAVLGGRPNFVLHPQNSLLSVSNWTWTSSPMTIV